ncbi:MAG: PilW family protein [Pseudomonadota bacterium]
MNHFVTRHERGFSLVELMIAITIGMVLTVAIGGIYVANINAFKNQDSNSRQQETMRAAMDAIGFHIRLAGYIDPATNDQMRVQLLQPDSKLWLSKQLAGPQDDLLSRYFKSAPQYTSASGNLHGVMGCKGLFNTATTLALPWTCTTTGPSAITVAYQVRPIVSGAPAVARAANGYIDSTSDYNANTGVGADCGGNDVTAAAASPAGPLAINRFYVDTTTNRLMCMGNGDPSKPKPIAEGVEDMYILYGIPPVAISPTVPGDAVVAKYVTADNVTDWTKVLSVRVCLQVVSSAKNVAPGVTSYKDCTGASKTISDGLYRQISSATFALRNNVLSSPDVLP